MPSASVPDHEIITVTPDMTDLHQQCYDIRVAVFVEEQGQSIYSLVLSSSYDYN